MQWILFSWSVAAILVLLYILYVVIGLHLRPLHQLADSAQTIAEGNLNTPIADTRHKDETGRMQHSLAQMVSDIQHVNDELERHNDELAKATQIKQETNRRKTAFIQDMYHEIRTPLNIISGFAQVLAASLNGLNADEVSDITSRMKESAGDISRLTRQLKEAANNPNV